MLHHTRPFIQAVEADRRADAARRRRSSASAELGPLVEAAARGEDAAWTTLMRRFVPLVGWVARRHRLGAHDVEDVVQYTFLRLFERIDSVRDPEALAGWLDTTARRQSLRVLRDRAREQLTDQDLDATTASPDRVGAALQAEQTRAELDRALASLPDREERLLRALVADKAPSYEDVSRTLGMPIGSIGPTRGRALARLRRDERLAAVSRFDVD